MEEGKLRGREGASIDFPTAENEWEIREREIADSREGKDQGVSPYHKDGNGA